MADAFDSLFQAPTLNNINPELRDALIKHGRNAVNTIDSQAHMLEQMGRAGEYASHQAIQKSYLQNLQDALVRADQMGLGAEHLGLLKKYVTGDPTALQGLEELQVSKKANDKAQSQLADFRNRAESQIFGGPGATLQQALANPNSELGGLGEFLKGQQNQVFQENLRPLIEMKLNAQGLGNSGANVELQSKALGDLERARQSQLMTAGLNYKDNIRGLERSDILGDIGAQQSALTNLSSIQRMGVSMDFEREMNARREALARELSSVAHTGPSMLQQVLGYTGAAGSAIAAPFTGGASLAAMPGFLGLAMGSGGQSAGAGIGALGQSFYAGGNSSAYGINNKSGMGSAGYAPGYPTYASMGPSWNGYGR